MRVMTTLLAFLLICTLAGAGTIKINDELVQVVLDELFEMRIHQSARLENEKLSIKFLDVLEDSLCPAGAQCIWEGVVVIHMKVTKGQGEDEYLLAHRPGSQSHNGVPRVAVADNYKIQFLEFKQDSALLRVFKEEDDQENDLEGVWSIYKEKVLSSEWHHKMGKIIKKLKYDEE